MSFKTKILDALLWIATMSSAAVIGVQQGGNSSENDDTRLKTEISIPQDIDGQEVYLAGIAIFTAGLDQETLKLAYKNGDIFVFTSDNGFIIFAGNRALTTVVKNGKLSYMVSHDVKSRNFDSTRTEKDIEMIQKFVTLYAEENSTIYKALKNRNASENGGQTSENNNSNTEKNKDSTIYKSGSQQINSKLQQKESVQDGVWHVANNSVGKIKYKFEKGTFIIAEGSTYNYIRLPRPEIQYSYDDGYYFIGEGMCKSMDMSTVYPSYWAHMNSVWVHYGVVLDLKEREKNEVLSEEEYEFIQRFEKTIKQYGLALDANNKVVLSEQISGKSDVWYFQNDMSM